jgi:hypothetical protein
MIDPLDPQPGLVRTHTVCHAINGIPVVIGLLAMLCFATGALPVGVLLLLVAVLLGGIAWIASYCEHAYDKTHHYDITNED